MRLIERDRITGEEVEITGLRMRLGTMKVIADYTEPRGWFYVAARLSNDETLIAGRFDYRYER